jgi:phage gp37-like protein
VTEKIRVDSLSFGTTFFSIWVMFSGNHPKKDLPLTITSHWKTFQTIENLRGKVDYYHSFINNSQSSFDWSMLDP